MRESRYAEDRRSFIERVQEWFLQKDQFWLVLSILTLSAVLVLEVMSVFASGANPHSRQQSEFLLVPLLALFSASIFWRSIAHTFLSFTGSSITYGGLVASHVADSSQAATSYVANRLGYGIKHLVVLHPGGLSDVYFVVGMFALSFCLAMAVRPRFFRPKNPEMLPYSVWKGSKACRTAQRSGLVVFVPLLSLLTDEEQHMVARYKYVILVISGARYLVTPYDWVPAGSVVLRDDESNSIIGVL